MRYRSAGILKDPVWVKVISLSLILFFVFLADAILSFWVPNFFKKVYENTAMVGLVMAFSSAIGLAADLILPQIIKGVTVRKLALFGIISSIVFSLTLLELTFSPLIFFALLSMGIWGIYYELLGFAQQQFIADSTPLKLHPAAWGLLASFKSLAYFLGPFVASFFWKINERYALYAAIVFAALSLTGLFLHGKKHDRKLEFEVDKVDILSEFEHWVILFKHVWPVIILSITLGIIDSFFWTIGPIWTEKLSERSFVGNLFVSVYILPSLFMGYVFLRWNVYKGKKKLALKFFLASSVVMTLLGISDNPIYQVAIVLVSSTLIALVYPLVDGVYSDIVARMGRERRHLIGLTSSAFSFAYIIGPPISGIISSLLSERKAFSVMGIFSIIIALLLLASTPKKIKLPQREIHEWE